MLFGIVVFEISKSIASQKNLPTSFRGAIVRETQRAYRIRELSENREVWIPKSCVRRLEQTEEKVEIKQEPPKRLATLHQKNPPTLRLTFSYDPKLIAKVKTIRGRKWVPKTLGGEGGYWTVPMSVEVFELLDAEGFQYDSSLKDMLLSGGFKTTRTKRSKTEVLDEIKQDIPQLYPFQVEGVVEIESRNGRALLADEMGLGKTVQALVWMKQHADAFPAVIVVPASLKVNWYREARKWVPNAKTTYVSGRTANVDEIRGYDIVVINYDILPMWVHALESLDPKTVIFDEAHYIKNRSAKRTRAAKHLATKVEHVVTITGTPVENRPAELYMQINVVNPQLFPSYARFAERYCGRRWNGFGWDDRGATRTDELHEVLKSTVMIRRLKKDVLKDLPDKQRSIIPLDITNAAEYEKAHRDIVKYLSDIDPKKAASAERAEILARLTHLRRLAALGKIDAAAEWIENSLESGEKLVVFTWHRSILERLYERFKDRAVYVQGGMSPKARQEAVDRFQTDDTVRLFIGQLKAAGVGLTLTASSNAVFVELPWTPTLLDQAEDRVHRIGQEADKVNIWYLVAVDTIEEDMLEVLDAKRKVVSEVVDGESAEDEAILYQLISRLKGDEFLAEAARAQVVGG